MYNSSGTTNVSTIGYDYQNCPFKLPCGYCTKLYQDCPKQGNMIGPPYWSLDKITCNAGEKDNG